MTIVKFPNTLMSVSARGSFGFGRGYGGAQRGKMRYGSNIIYSGIYQRKKTLQGYRVSQMKFYRPSNPQTPTQQAWRDIFSAGWVEYGLLTPTEKMLLSKEAQKLRLSGPQLFLKRWLQGHTI